ncbi:CHAD domain-containing protein [Flaviaesturariibacter flavus]|uniref:CHAD domain-containing protein n=1 Tax=Flaviaesturariibacter flavus TaxID=2502780 RepID=A0A4R1BJI7_9BACT|nr:CHAD domain-containing protein [Flaviaesturariibacter flavus]TCJ17407.1 CHAD domain-containing protein [Flaviaesturariibacter flavus]
MKKKEAISFLRQRGHVLARRSRKLLKEFAAEDIHRFRVEVKKLRAFVALCRAGGEVDRRLRIGKKMHAFYHAVGELRGLQIQEQTVLRLCAEPPGSVPYYYLENLHAKQTAMIKEVRRQGRSWLHSRCCRRMEQALKKNRKIIRAESFLPGVQQELRRLLAVATPGEEQLHELRKILKSLLYLWPLIGTDIAACFPEQIMSKESCLALSDTLGAFQDMRMVPAYLVPDFLAGVPLRERRVLKKISSHCHTWKLTLKAEAYLQLAELRCWLFAHTRP